MSSNSYTYKANSGSITASLNIEDKGSSPIYSIEAKFSDGNGLETNIIRNTTVKDIFSIMYSKQQEYDKYFNGKNVLFFPISSDVGNCIQELEKQLKGSSLYKEP